MLAQKPVDFDMLVIKGKFQMGYQGADGEPVVFNVAAPLASPVSGLSYPTHDGEIGRTELNTTGHLDVVYTPSDGATLIDGELLDSAPEFSLQLKDGTPLPDVTIQDSEVTKIDDITFRYPFTGSFPAEQINLVFASGTFADSGGIANESETKTFVVREATSTLSAPSDEGTVDIEVITSAGGRFLSVTHVPTPGNRIDESTITDADDVLILTFADGTATTISGPGTAIDNDGDGKIDDTSYTYAIPDSVNLAPGLATVEFLAGTWADTGDNQNIASTETFTITGATADLAMPLHGGTIDAALFASQGYIDVTFAPTKTGTVQSDTIDSSDIAVIAPDGNTIPVDASQFGLVEGSDNTYRFQLTLPTPLPVGTYKVHFADAGWTSISNPDTTPVTYANVAEIEHFTIVGSTAQLADSTAGGVIGSNQVNEHQSLDIEFKATSGAGLNFQTPGHQSSLFDPVLITGDEISVTDSEFAPLELDSTRPPEIVSVSGSGTDTITPPTTPWRLGLTSMVVATGRPTLRVDLNDTATDFVVEAAAADENFLDVSLEIVDGPTGSSAVAAYDSATKVITVSIESGVSTINDLVAAIDALDAWIAWPRDPRA